MNPFALSSGDYSAFMNDIGSSLYQLPSWGGIVQWRARYVLAFAKVDGTWALTDISGGIPAASAPGGVVPVEALLHDVPRVETPAWQVFFYSLPGNIYDVATERAAQLAAAAERTGEVIGNVGGSILGPLIPVAVIAAVVLAVMYLPRSRS